MTPLVLLAGFLGAGKTTLLRQLLPQLAAGGVRPRVILNDLENARLDAALVRDLAPELLAMDGACLCCDTQDALLEALAASATRGYDCVLVETNGTADVGALIELITDAPELSYLAPLTQVTVVDVQRFGTREWMNAIELDQLATATDVVLAKTDLADQARLVQVIEAVDRVAPRSRRTTVADIARRIGESVRHQALPGTIFSTTAASVVAHKPHSASDSLHHALASAAFQLAVPFDVDAQAFLAFLESLPREIVRAKGVVVLRDPPGEKRSFHKVGDACEISPCQLYEPDTIDAAAVFVGVGVSRDEIAARLNRLRA